MHNHITEEKVNIEIKNMERAIMSLRNDTVCGPEDIYASELLKDEIKKLY